MENESPKPTMGRPYGVPNATDDPFISSLKGLQRQITKLIAAHRASRKHEYDSVAARRAARNRDEMREETAELARKVLGIFKEGAE